MSFPQWTALFVAALASAACGYRFVDERAVFGPDVKSIELNAFDNRSTEPGYEHMLLGSLEEEFARRGALEPVYGGRGGELVLAGLIREVRVRASSFSSVELAVEDAIEVELDVTVHRAGETDPVWSGQRMRFSELFLSSPDPQVYESNKEQALRRLSAAVAESIHDGLFRTF